MWRPPGYYRRRYPARVDRLEGGLSSWVHRVNGELMLVLALPPGYVLPSVDDAQPAMVRCKELAGQGRMAVYWILKRTQPQVNWKMEAFQGDVSTHLAALNDEGAKRAPPPHPWTIIDGEYRERKKPPPTTFVIHGHDDSGVQELKEVLKELKVEAPVVMKDRLRNGIALPVLFEELAKTATVAIALLTPDDPGGALTGQLLATPSQQSLRARQNAWLEIGWFWANLGLDHVMMLVKGDIEIPSDLHGLILHRYDEKVAELSDRIRQFYDQHLGL